MRYLIILTAVMYFGGDIRADLVSQDFCHTSASQSNPAIGNKYVCWQETGNGTDIKAVDLTDPTHTIMDICVAGDDQTSPATDGDLIVWRDEIGYSTTHYDIYRWDGTLALADRIGVICADALEQSYPETNGDVVVFQDKRSGNFDVAKMDYSGGTASGHELICNDLSIQYRPDIDADTVVWLDTRNSAVSGYDIYAYDLVSGTETLICDDAGHQKYPRISGDWIVWQDDGYTPNKLVAYNNVTETQIVISEATSQIGSADICGNTIVWIDDRGSDGDVYAFDLEGYFEYAVCTNSNNSLTPVVNDNSVAWAENGHIEFALLPVKDIVVTKPVTGSTVFAGKDLFIEWQSSFPETELVTIEYSADHGQSWQLAVANIENTGSYKWTAPLDESDMAMVRVSIAGQEYETDASGMFEVLGCDPTLTADLSGDCVVDLLDLQILASQWMQKGY